MGLQLVDMGSKCDMDRMTIEPQKMKTWRIWAGWTPRSQEQRSDNPTMPTFCNQDQTLLVGAEKPLK
jgi:hypothetical protein